MAMFRSIKNFKKEDLVTLCVEIDEELPNKVTINSLKEAILKSKVFADDPEFVEGILLATIEERKLNEEKTVEAEREQKEYEKQMQHEELQRQHELEIARLNAGVVLGGQEITEAVNVRKKFHLPKLELRQFSGNLKDWLPFWSQFEHVHNDLEIEPENKFQYLIQATVNGSRAREVVDSFPPTGANYIKAIESLKSRFGRNDLLIEFYVRELLKLVIQNAQRNASTNLCVLYDSLESQIRALETLGVTTDKSAALLQPLVESCLPEDILRAWQRQRIPATDQVSEPQDRLMSLLKFLKSEVESEERISLAMQGFGLNKKKEVSNFKYKKFESVNDKAKPSTASSLLNKSQSQDFKKLCVFCGKSHASADCFSARKMSLEDRQNVLKEKNCCYACLTPGHQVKNCRNFVKCLICSKKHTVLMCDQLSNTNKRSSQSKEECISITNDDVNLSNCNLNPKVFLQTFRAKILSGDREKIVRVLCDTGSQRSYILKNVAEEMRYPVSRQEVVRHSLFGGVTTKEYRHSCYRIRLRNLDGSFSCNFEALDQTTICENVQPVSNGSWLEELKKIGVVLTDTNSSCASIQVLIGADILGRLLTGKRRLLSSGLVAVETQLGWTLMGKVPKEDTEHENLAMTVTSMFVKEADISSLWRLDIIGIHDPIEKKSKQETDLRTALQFKETVNFHQGRYEVCLPWADDRSPLPNNYSLARKRLDFTTSKLKNMNLYEEYNKVFSSWLEEGIIEEVPEDEVQKYGSYLPHHPVLKLGSTTPIRPVFDASAKMVNQPSLNQCLESGPNLIELIPDILLRFRENKIGVTADIRRAFLQISVKENDRDVLRFLWWKNEGNQELKVFRHTRVVFGVKCSPFLLGAVIEHHIENNKSFDADFKNKLQKSFYVDNVVTSIGNQEELKEFVANSSAIMREGGFDLRGWENSDENTEELNKAETPLLGFIWNREKDILRVNLSWINEINLEKLTKREILSIAHKVYDPIGFTSPVMIFPKLILQEAWRLGICWDEEIPDSLRLQFVQWFNELKHLEEIHIPRWIQVDRSNLAKSTLHCFCDASKDAYAAVVILRVENDENVELRLIAAKARITPLKGGGGTIPRKELLAALVGARLTNSIIEALDWKEIKCHYWSDSTTVIAWISREENWSVFVRNRVNEIRKISDPSSWHHVPGERNPSDLPSRGCNAKQLVSLAWWEGPEWLKRPLEETMSIANTQYIEEEIKLEKLKAVKTLTNTESTLPDDWYYKHFSNYHKIVRMIGWILRFMNNCKNPKTANQGELSVKELEEAEIRIMKIIQKETFLSEDDPRLKSLGTFKDEKQILRLKTKLIYRKDQENFIKPIVLPSKHPVVERLILHIHEKNCHAGVQITLSQLREKYWVLSGRKTVSAVLSKCVTCKKFNSKNIEADPGPLPENRVKDAAVFQIVGIDMAGPLFLRDQKKSWVLIFTCAVYRAVHFELVSSASTDAFLMAFRRFVARRGRCSVIYCDNGTNFVGAANALKHLDWKRIEKHGTLNSIQWKFNPPSAAWWGGWWERLIRLLKDLLKRVLGKACLSYEEMGTILVDCESVINTRPLTYIFEKECLKPISPNMFLQDVYECSLPDVDTIDQKSLIRRIKYRLSLQKDLRARFRSEYLGLLIQRKIGRQDNRRLAVGDIVLIGYDNRKRIDWPLGRIIQLLPAKDGSVRLVRVQTANNQLLRPVQRVHPLEITSPSEYPLATAQQSSTARTDQTLSEPMSSLPNSSPETNLTKTIRGRVIRVPKRMDL